MQNVRILPNRKHVAQTVLLQTMLNNSLLKDHCSLTLKMISGGNEGCASFGRNGENYGNQPFKWIPTTILAFWKLLTSSAPDCWTRKYVITPLISVARPYDF
jgi:hypothetical protein